MGKKKKDNHNNNQRLASAEASYLATAAADFI